MPDIINKIREQQAIYIHIPKCAGSSIDTKIYGQRLISFEDGLWLQHLTAPQLRNTISDELWKSSFKFTIVRNPFDRIESSFRWFCRIKQIEPTAYTFSQFVFLDEPFKKIFGIEKARDIKNRYHHIKPMHEYIYEKNKLLVDYVGKFENIDATWENIKRRSKLKGKLPKVNTTKKGPSLYTPATIQEVYRKHKRDCDLWYPDARKSIINTLKLKLSDFNH